MKIYDEKHIKNVAFVGAHNSGKTTLAETMLFEAGLLNRRGSVEDKNTVADYHAIEQERETSVFATPLHTEWRNYKINIIDTPGLDDFIWRNCIYDASCRFIGYRYQCAARS